MAETRQRGTPTLARLVNGKIVYSRPELNGPHDVEVIQELPETSSHQRSSLGPDRRPLRQRQIQQGRRRSSATPYNRSNRRNSCQDASGNFLKNLRGYCLINVFLTMARSFFFFF